MTTITVTPTAEDDLYTLLQDKERKLRQAGRGTLHRRGRRKRGEDKWVHSSYKGHIKLHKAVGGVAVAIVHGGAETDEWQLVTSFVGFLLRHFREEVGSVVLSVG